MSSIYDVSSVYDTYSQNIKSTTGSSVQGALASVDKDSSDEELMAVCKDFESYFVQKVIEQARASILDNEEDKDGGEYLKMFGDTLNQSLAETITENGGTGLAQQLYDSMKRNYTNL